MRNTIILLSLFFIAFSSKSQQTEYYLGVQSTPNNGYNLLGQIFVSVIDNNSFFLIHKFIGNKVDSIQYSRYRDPYRFAYYPKLNFKYPAIGPVYSTFCVINNMYKDSIVNSFSVSPLCSVGANADIYSNIAFGENILLTGEIGNCDTIQISGSSNYKIKVNKNSTFILCLTKNGQFVFYKSLAPSYSLSILNVNADQFTIKINGNPTDLSTISPSLSTLIYNDTSVTSLIAAFNGNGDFMWQKYGTIPNGGSLTALQNQRYEKRMLVYGDYNTSLKSSNSAVFKNASSSEKITHLRKILTSNGNETYFSILDIEKNGKLLNHYWLKFNNSFSSVAKNLFYCKNGFIFNAFCSSDDSLMFGKDNVAWKSLKITKNEVKLIMVDTIKKTISICKTPIGIFRFRMFNDTSFICIGDVISGVEPLYDFDLSSTDKYPLSYGTYFAQYTTSGNLVWARKFNKYAWTGAPSDEFLSKLNNTVYLYSINSRNDMDLGFRNLQKLSTDAENHWVTKLNCKPIADYSFDITGGCANFIHLGTLGVNFKWEFGDGTFEIKTRYPKHCYTSNGKFVAKLITYNSCGADTAFYNVIISRAKISSLSVKQVMFNIYPNPTKTEFTIDPVSDGPYSYSLYSIDGKLIKIGNGFTRQNIENLNGNSSGVLILKIVKDEIPYNFKIITTE